MKRLGLIAGLIAFYSFITSAQVVIGGVAPDSSAMLDIQSTSRGLLLPRLTSEERDSIKFPAEGLQVYNLSTHCLEINVGTSVSPLWLHTKCRGVIDTLYCDSAQVSLGLTVNTPADNRLLTIPYGNGNAGSYPSQELTSTGVSGLDLLLVKSDFEKGDGQLVYRLSGIPQDTGYADVTIQIDNQVCNVSLRVDQGLVDTLYCNNASFTGGIFDGHAVDSIELRIPYSGGNGAVYDSDTIAVGGVSGVEMLISGGILSLSADTFVIELRGVPDTTGVLEFPVSIGEKSCLIEELALVSGLVYYPTGYVPCNPANPTVVQDVTNPTTGKTWMDRNLGASRVATAYNDHAAYGALFQWGRFADGHQCRYGPSTGTIATTAEPNQGNSWDGKFIKANSGWLEPGNNNLWQGVNGVNNPCPKGYRLPTNTEWAAERSSMSQPNVNGAYESPLKLPAGGSRSIHQSPDYEGIGSVGSYWSSTGPFGWPQTVFFASWGGEIRGISSGWGLSVRCLKD